MADFGAVEARHRIRVPPAPVLPHRMRGNGDAALTVDLVDGNRGALTEANPIADADRDQMVMGLRQYFFADEHGGTADAAREPASEAAVEHFVVSRDGDRVEPRALRFEHQPPRRQRDPDAPREGTIRERPRADGGDEQRGRRQSQDLS